MSLTLVAFEERDLDREPAEGCTCVPSPHDVFGHHPDPGHIGFAHFEECPVTERLVQSVAESGVA